MMSGCHSVQFLFRQHGCFGIHGLNELFEASREFCGSLFITDCLFLVVFFASRKKFSAALHQVHDVRPQASTADVVAEMKCRSPIRSTWNPSVHPSGQHLLRITHETARLPNYKIAVLYFFEIKP